MKVVYIPTGRALEYSLLAVNPWGKSFCQHACTYCYCPSMFHMSRSQWEKEPFRPRKNIIKLLRQDCEELRGTDKRVLCCFAGDLYSPEAAKSGISRQILEIFREFDVPFQVLTKGGMRAVPDFDLYGPNDAFATTLVFVPGGGGETHEPGAASTFDRVQAIVAAKEQGIETWVSLEPVIDPEQSLQLIVDTQEYVDLYKIGKLNHDKVAEAKIDWEFFAHEAMNLCNKFGKPFILKKDLLAYCDFEIVGAATFDPRAVIRTCKKVE